MPGQPDAAILESARELAIQAERKEPLLSGKTKSVLLASAYYLRSTSTGKHISIYDVASMFGVSDNAIRPCIRLMASSLGIQTEKWSAARTRNNYDIYAEILRNPGYSLRGLVQKVHITTKELQKHLKFLMEKRLIAQRREAGRTLYFPTEKGQGYLGAYDSMRKVLQAA